MHIDLATNVPGLGNWNNHIAVSADGKNWNALFKSFLDVIPVFIIGTGTVKDQGDHTATIRLVNPEGKEKLYFNLKDIENQPTWLDTQEGLNQAAVDITEWINL